MQKILKTPSGAWQISATVTNGHHSWVEFRTYYGTSRNSAIAGFYTTVQSMGWLVV